MLSYKNYSHPRLSPNSVTNIDDLVFYGHNNSKNKLLCQTDEISCYELIREETYKYNYNFNKFGFRDTWKLDSNKPNIGFFGCSFTFGEFVESDKTFSKLTARQLGYNDFNFGLLGSSIERTAYLFSAANRVIDLDYAVITLPDWNRTLYLNNDSNGISYLDLIHTVGHNKIIDSFKKIIYSFSDDYFIHQAIRNINWIIDVAEKHSVKLLVSSWEENTSKLVDTVFPQHSIGKFDILDKVIDGHHPGEFSHEQYAKKIIKVLNETI
jgi:hypothetical protein